jgi:protein arginine kinase activator
MQCQFCTNPATVHLTDIINKQKREVHLCEACAQQHNLLPATKSDLNVPALLQFLLGQSLKGIPSVQLSPQVCPHCGTTAGSFRAQGRLGCPHDYELFQAILKPVLERVHRSVIHVGKVPKGIAEHRLQAEITDLRRQLQQAVADEHYEAAVILRDQIRAKEARNAT